MWIVILAILVSLGLIPSGPTPTDYQIQQTALQHQAIVQNQIETNQQTQITQNWDKEQLEE
jgi:hypothetical protein